ncbi:MAG: aldo/keto reductase [bacterium JZ-2024 1]
METVFLGNSELKVTRIGLGCWQFGTPGWGWGETLDEKQALRIIDASLDAGINWLDTAEVYGDGISEEIIGKALRGKRDKVIIATKVSGNHLKKIDVKKAIEGSLKRLHTDYVDLYQVHWHNPYVSLSETMEALKEVVQEGKARYIGVSNFSRTLTQEARKYFRPGELISNQVRYNLLRREIEKEILPYCRRAGMSIIAYSPLAQSLLTGKFKTYEQVPSDIRKENPLFSSKENFQKALRVVETVEEIARDRKVAPSQVALRWVIEHKGVVAIPGAKTVDQAQQNAGTLYFSLSHQEMALLDKVSSSLSISVIENY